MEILEQFANNPNNLDKSARGLFKLYSAQYVGFKDRHQQALTEEVREARHEDMTESLAKINRLLDTYLDGKIIMELENSLTLE